MYCHKSKELNFDLNQSLKATVEIKFMSKYILVSIVHIKRFLQKVSIL